MDTEPSVSSDSGASAIDLGRVKLGAFYVAVLATIALMVNFTFDLLPLLVLGWFDQAAIAELGIHRFHVMGIALFVSLGLALMLTQLYRPRDHPGALLVAVTMFAAATILFALLGSESIMLGVFFLVPAAIALVLHPAGRSMFRPQEGLSPVMLGLYALALVPILLFVVGQLTLQIQGAAADEHVVFEHYAMMGLLGLSFVVGGAIAVSRVRGWRVTTWLVGIVLVLFGLQSALFVGQVGATGSLWGALAVVWAVAFVASGEYSRREDATGLFRRETPRIGARGAA